MRRQLRQGLAGFSSAPSTDEEIRRALQIIASGQHLAPPMVVRDGRETFNFGRGFVLVDDRLDVLAKPPLSLQAGSPYGIVLDIDENSMKVVKGRLVASQPLSYIVNDMRRFAGRMLSDVLDSMRARTEVVATVPTETPGPGAVPKAGVGGTLDMGWLDSAVVTQSELTAALGTLTTAMTGRRLGVTVLTIGSTFTSRGTATMVRIRMVGGGGGGGGCTSAAGQAAGGGGGGAGGYLEVEAAITPSTVYSYVVGALGAKGANTGADGSVGGDSTFTIGATVYTAKGGLGGKGMLAGTTIDSALGGSTSPVSINGDLNCGGPPGSPSKRDTGLICISGQGGSCLFGGGGPAFKTLHNGAPGNGFGGGGGGGNVINGGGAVTGGDGLPGVIIVEEFS